MLVSVNLCYSQHLLEKALIAGVWLIQRLLSEMPRTNICIIPYPQGSGNITEEAGAKHV